MKYQGLKFNNIYLIPAMEIYKILLREIRAEWMETDSMFMDQKIQLKIEILKIITFLEAIIRNINNLGKIWTKMCKTFTLKAK